MLFEDHREKKLPLSMSSVSCRQSTISAVPAMIIFELRAVFSPYGGWLECEGDEINQRDLIDASSLTTQLCL